MAENGRLVLQLSPDETQLNKERVDLYCGNSSSVSHSLVYLHQRLPELLHAAQNMYLCRQHLRAQLSESSKKKITY